MKTWSIIFLIFVSSGIAVNGQHSGNKALKNNERFKPTGVNRLYLNDSSFVIQADVLMNVIADAYVVTFGVSDAAPTLQEANVKINTRIKNFTDALIKSGIPENHIYIDNTTQTTIADYKVNGNIAEQYISGFEQKKNVIIRTATISDLDKMVLLAAGFEIYDLVKVDYIVTNSEKIYDELFAAAIEAIQHKKELYVKATNVKLSQQSQIYAESFYSLYPPDMYESYNPSVSSDYTDYSNYAKKKNLRKNTTYYFDKINYSGFSKIFNPIVTEPAVAFVLTLQIKFSIE